jgi:hypothetical protein
MLQNVLQVLTVEVIVTFSKVLFYIILSSSGWNYTSVKTDLKSINN